MPIFVTGGPDVPEQLLHAQEEGRLVFFCGAGISVPAGLPLFGKLVDLLYEKAGITPNGIESVAIKNGQYDTAIELLEQRHTGGRQAVREKLKDSLTPDFARKSARTMHEALLILGTNRDGALRVITTNYDHLFREAAKSLRYSKPIPEFSAPLLPIPKPSQWDGLVYIHGLLPEDNSGKKLERLVLSSSDFGLAYLTERWASRFVTELFKNYTVCFVGYSLNDPVMRYMVDAIAADKKRGDIHHNEIYAFAGFKKNSHAQIEEEWKAKKITPILYDCRGRGHQLPHAKLYSTFETWAAIYRDGLTGKKNIISKYAANPPLANLAKHDEAVGNVLWALTDANAANYFSTMTPLPPLNWLEPLSTPQFSTNDLNRFGFYLSPDAKKLKTEFSFLDRPAPHTTSRMRLLHNGWDSGWDDIMHALAEWLLRHLNNPEMALWLSRSGGCLNERFAQMLKQKLETQSSSSDPDATPDALMRNVWSLFLANRVGVSSLWDDMEIYSVLAQIRTGGITYGLKLMLQYALTPCILLRKPYSFSGDRDKISGTRTLRGILNWEIRLRSGHIQAALEYSMRKEGHDEWTNAQHELLAIFNLLLKDLLELKSLLGEANSKSDMSYIHQPSIEEHAQNNQYEQWTVLIELLRDAWIYTSKIDAHAAARMVDEWWNTPYPLFKRLALFACKHTNIIPPETIVEWLLVDEAYWLWSIETQREAMRLLDSFGASLPHSLCRRLEDAILIGPSRAMFKPDLTPERWAYIVDQMKWLRLAKLHSGGSPLSDHSRNIFQELSDKHPEFCLRENEREEFVVWMGDDRASPVPTTTPKSCEDLANYLEQYPNVNQWEPNDDWEIRCRSDFSTILCALKKLAQKGVWATSRWQSLLYAPIEGNPEDIFSELSIILVTAPEKAFEQLNHPVATWLEKASREITPNNDLFIEMCKKVLSDTTQDSAVDSDDYLTRAINHPVGKTTEALVNMWHKTGIHDEQGIVQNFKDIFTKLCDTSVTGYQHGRIILCINVILFYRIDSDWTKEYLFPLFNWENSEHEAAVAWQGFLFSPRLYQPFIAEIKNNLLSTVNYYSALGKCTENYVAIMTYIALDPREEFSQKELRTVFSALPADGLIASIHTLNREMKSGDAQTKDYWDNRIEPFFSKIWPNGKKELITDAVSEAIAYFCVYSGDNFPTAMKLPIASWIRPFPHPGAIFLSLLDSGLCKKFPTESLNFLSKVIDDNIYHMQGKIKECLGLILEGDPSLKDAPDFFRLSNIVG